MNDAQSQRAPIVHAKGNFSREGRRGSPPKEEKCWSRGGKKSMPSDARAMSADQVGGKHSEGKSIKLTERAIGHGETDGAGEKVPASSGCRSFAGKRDIGLHSTKELKLADLMGEEREVSCQRPGRNP